MPTTPPTLTFVGRTAELAALQAAYKDRASTFLPVYGRRRVGKTELLLRFLHKKPAVYFQGKEAPADLQIRDFLRTAAATLDQPLLSLVSTGSWRTALETVVAQRPKNKKLILVLDEFQWSASASPELPSVIQELWDHRWSRDGSVMLVLCGSYLGFMEREVLGSKSPLFGRRTGQILLRPFPHDEAALFHPTLPPADLASTYFLCGGIPHYLRFFDPARSVEQNICDNLLSPHAALSREPDFLLREELRELEKYDAILTAIATGSPTAVRIARDTGIPERSLFYYIDQLVSLGYLARRYPLTPDKPAKRHVRFSVEDPLLRFWFRFVFPNLSLIARLGPAESFTRLVEPDLPSYFGSCFENLCREALPGIYARENVTADFTAGEYWDKTTQIDLVSRRSDRHIDVAECKWGKIPSWPKLRDDVRDRARTVPNPDNHAVHPRIFSRYRPPSRTRLDGITLHTLTDIYPSA